MGEVSASRHVVMLLTNNSYPHDSRVPKEAQALIDAGYRVSVISKRARRSPRRETIEGVRVHRFRLPGDAQTPLGYVFEFLYAALASFALSVRILVREGFDVLHLHNPPDTLGLVAVLHKKLFRKRVVFDHGCAFQIESLICPSPYPAKATAPVICITFMPSAPGARVWRAM